MNLRQNLISLEERIANACQKAGRNRSDVLLIAVSKTNPAELIEEAYELGIRDFGENRVQELIKKKDLLSTAIRWHQIGHLQSNKAKFVAPFVLCVHSIDSLDTAIELSRRAEENARTIDVLIEVNVAQEPTKYGVLAGDAEKLLADILFQAPNLRPKGLMTMAPFEDYPENTRPYFRALRKLRDEIAGKHADIRFTELSMGMTNDFVVAIEEGATMIRLGSALFGERE